jgi:hypothetical protein
VLNAVGGCTQYPPALRDTLARSPVEQGMADIVNLRTARKRSQRKRQEGAAAANRLSHGRLKSKRRRETAQREQASHGLDQHRIEPGGER